MVNKQPHFGGTDITLEKLTEVLPTWLIDGSTYQLKDWLDECKIFEQLIPGKSKVWVPYGGAEKFGILQSVVWRKVEFRRYGFKTEETEDWWFYEPYLEVECGNSLYYVYEYSCYEQNIMGNGN